MFRDSLDFRSCEPNGGTSFFGDTHNPIITGVRTDLLDKPETDHVVIEPLTPHVPRNEMRNGVTLGERLDRLEKLDLKNVRRKLMEPEPEGKGWTEEQAIQAEKWYKRYLGIILREPDATMHVPNGPIDFFWHQHILDTMRYGDDCRSIFGYFLHHYPYYGLNGDADKRDNSFNETNALYRKYFNEDCTMMDTFTRPSAEHCNTPTIDGGEICHADSNGAQGKTNCGVGPDADGGATCGRGAKPVAKAVSCGGGGSGTGCGQGNCGGSHRVLKSSVMSGAQCNDAGSGTGCGQGCSRGG